MHERDKKSLWLVSNTTIIVVIIIIIIIGVWTVILTWENFINRKLHHADLAITKAIRCAHSRSLLGK